MESLEQWFQRLERKESKLIEIVSPDMICLFDEVEVVFEKTSLFKERRERILSCYGAKYGQLVEKAIGLTGNETLQQCYRPTDKHRPFLIEYNGNGKAFISLKRLGTQEVIEALTNSNHRSTEAVCFLLLKWLITT